MFTNVLCVGSVAGARCMLGVNMPGREIAETSLPRARLGSASCVALLRVPSGDVVRNWRTHGEAGARLPAVL
jgi:hypothetical protein